jgi:S-adenosyl methyltransferase
MSDQTGKPAPDGPGAGGGGQAPGPDTKHAHSARVYNYWLGDKDNYAADREAAEQAIAANPGIVADVRANRAFLARAVRYLATERGIRQFLDIGTGLPTASNTHEVAQAARPRRPGRLRRQRPGLDLVEPGVVQPQQWRPDPGARSPLQVTAWCGVARKP